jgi:hypothetical protein
MSTTTATHTVTVVVTDLQRDDRGWSANGCWAHRYTATAPTYLGACRMALAQSGAAGWRRDGWAGGESWRLPGTAIGAYVEENG